MPTSKLSTSSDGYAAARRQLVAACIEKEDYKTLLLELLAIIHRDGGHYTVLAGLPASYELAEHTIPNTYRKLAAVSARLSKVARDRDGR